MLQEPETHREGLFIFLNTDVLDFGGHFLTCAFKESTNIISCHYVVSWDSQIVYWRSQQRSIEELLVGFKNTSQIGNVLQLYIFYRTGSKSARSLIVYLERQFSSSDEYLACRNESVHFWSRRLSSLGCIHECWKRTWTSGIEVEEMKYVLQGCHSLESMMQSVSQQSHRRFETSQENEWNKGFKC